MKCNTLYQFCKVRDRNAAGTRRFLAMGALVMLGMALTGRVSQAQSFPLLPFSVNESSSSCTASLCIDAPPEGPNGLDGSGGWGYNSAAKKPVTTLTVDKPANFTVTVMQPSALPFCGAGTLTITLAYSSQDFSLSNFDSTGNAGVNPFDRGGVETYSYSGDFLCHMDQSVGFTFAPQHATNTALVTATVSVGGQQASEIFPVAILPKGWKN